MVYFGLPKATVQIRLNSNKFWCWCFICFILAVLGCCCGVWTFSSCGSRALEYSDSVVTAHGLSCSSACGILVPQQGIKPLHWKADCQSLYHHGSPWFWCFRKKKRNSFYFFGELSKYANFIFYLLINSGSKLENYFFFMVAEKKLRQKT